MWLTRPNIVLGSEKELMMEIEKKRKTNNMVIVIPR